MIVDASSINSIDITAADRLEAIASSMKKKGIQFYITEHSSNLNEQMCSLGIGHLIKEGCVRRTILAALNDADVQKPYDLEIPETEKKLAQIRSQSHLPAEEENTLEEFAWHLAAILYGNWKKLLTRSSSISIRCLTLRSYPTKVSGSISKTGMPLVLWTKMRSCTELSCISMNFQKNCTKNMDISWN